MGLPNNVLSASADDFESRQKAMSAKIPELSQAGPALENRRKGLQDNTGAGQEKWAPLLALQRRAVGETIARLRNASGAPEAYPIGVVRKDRLIGIYRRNTFDASSQMPIAQRPSPPLGATA